VREAAGQVPKVTGGNVKNRHKAGAILSSGFADEAIKHKADEEIHEQPGIGLKWAVGWEREMGGEQEIGDVAEDDG
jgi:hypothetical protein